MNIKKSHPFARIIFTTIFFLVFLVSIYGNNAGMKKPVKETTVAPDTLSITNWLLLGPVSTALPVFHESKAGGFELKKLLEYDHFEINEWWPQEGDALSWFGNIKLQWKTAEILSDSVGLKLGECDTTQLKLAYAATYLETDRWLKVKLTVSSAQLLQVFVDGEVIVTKDSFDSPQDDGNSVKAGDVSGDITLETGKHLLVIKTIYAPKSKTEWNIKATVEIDKEFAGIRPAINLSPKHIFQIKQLLDGPKLGSPSVSPDGKLVAVTMHQSLPPSDDSEAWIELRRTGDGSLRQTFRGGMKISGLKWDPTGSRFSYTSSDKKSRTIWLVDLKRGTCEPLLKNIKELGRHTWAPDGSFIIYSVTEKPEPDKRGVKKLKGLPDRQKGWRNRSYLYRVTVPGGIRQRLTAGELSTDIATIHPDSKYLLFTVGLEDYAERPYGKAEVYRLDLTTLNAELLWKGKWLRSVSWSPDGRKLLVLAGPSSFGNLGVNVPAGTIPNDYDTQAYIFDPALKSGEAITHKFAPTINSAIWHKDGNIYFSTTEKEYRPLYRYNIKGKKITRIETGTEVLNRFSCALNAPVLAYNGAGATDSPRLYLLDLKKDKYKVISDPEKKTFEHVILEKVEPWSFVNKRGTAIEGRIYYPPKFDRSKKYPCIVYYYGGTSPVTRDFGGRYPKNFYAAQGYVVYVLQPSGATGFGQEFSALHVNDWGTIVADEIIDGVQKFLAAHDFVDPKHVGCIGASFGGFMTQLLLTKTDMFAAAISHAGISMIPSYWGEGYWGYAYSAVATANSFPWNRKDIYINQSPLFSADKIVTPLLLTHGAVDTNVPPGESEQMYTALKLLGKEVEYLKFDKQNHFIMTYNKRILWTKSIIAWFDKWLKNQPGFWNDLYEEAH